MGRRAVYAFTSILALLAACETDPAYDTRLPWWPDPRVAAPSPVLDAVGLAPPLLAGPNCRRGPSLAEDDTTWSAGFRRLAIGWEITCSMTSPTEPGATGFGPGEEPEAAVTLDGRGVAQAAFRQLRRPSPETAAAAEDSIVRRALSRPDAQPLTCRMEGWPFIRYTLGGPEPTVRGWRTAEYQAIVHAYPASLPDTAGTHVVHLRVSRSPFAACRPRGER